MLTTTSSVFERRLVAFGPRLRRQLARLYGEERTETLWPRLSALLSEQAAARTAELAALDMEREADPDWFVAPEMLGYSSYVDRFGGTVAGVASHVDHLEALGIRYLHLLALLKARAGDSDGGFAIADYLAVEPRLGTMADVERLTARLRKARISLCIDLALNHTADDHEWARHARSGDPFYRDFYHILTEGEARAAAVHLGQVFPATAPGNFTHVPDVDGWVWTTFYPFQWDLNWANPEVMLAMVETMLRLANHGIEAFRLDSTAFLWKQPGTDCRNLPHAHHIVRALRGALDIVAPATLLKAEAIVPTAFVPPYFGIDEGEGFEPECHLVYNNSLMVAGWVALAEQSAALPDAIIRVSGGIPAGANWLSYARCHDDIGWGTVLRDLAGFDANPEARLAAAARFIEGAGDSWAAGEAFQSDGSALHGTNGTLASLAGLETAADDQAREKAFRRIALLNALAIASGGLAVTYMGDELGLLNDHDYRSDPERAHEGRWLHRPLMAWDAVDTAAAHRIRHDLAGLRAARISSGFAGAPRRIETGLAEVLGLACGRDRVFLNFGDKAVTLADAAPETWCDRLTGIRATRAIEIEGLAIAWLGDTA